MANGTTVPGVFERIMQPFYSSASLATGGTSATFFQQTLGAATGGVWGSTIPTLADTNMTIPGALPAGYELEVKAIAFQLASNVSSPDARAIMRGGAFSFKIASKDQLQLPLECLTGGAGIDGYSSTALGAGNEIVHNGIADPRALYPMEMPITIRSNQNIVVRIDWAAAVTLLATQPMRVLLHGILSRPVQ